MRYNKGNINSTMNAAIREARNDGRLRYVYATCYGYEITKRKPTADLHQSFYCIGADSWAIAEYVLGSGRHVWSDKKQYAVGV